VSRAPKLASVRLYFDADVLGVAKVIAALRNDCTYPGDPGATIRKRHRPPCVIADRATPDSEWIPTVSRLGWLIITRDSRIQHNRAEIQAVRDAGARMVALSGPEAGTVWEQLEVLMSQWRRIEQLLEEPGPFVRRGTRSALSPVDLS
jgi:hypothetical protein